MFVPFKGTLYHSSRWQCKPCENRPLQILYTGSLSRLAIMRDKPSRWWLATDTLYRFNVIYLNENLSHDRNPVVGQYHPSDDLTPLYVKISVGRSRFGKQEKEVDSTELHYSGQRRESRAGKSPKSKHRRSWTLTLTFGTSVIGSWHPSPGCEMGLLWLYTLLVLCVLL